MDRDDIVQSVLITFCQNNELLYNNMSLTGDGRTFTGIQHVLQGPYCVLYNYFTMYTFMTFMTQQYYTQPSYREVYKWYNAFVRPYHEKHVQIQH
eukprot:887464-Pleurochrysis_carterae.AAC.1